MHNVFSYKDFEICDFKSLFEIENHPVTKIKKLKNELSIIIEINNNFLKKVKIKRSIKILPNGLKLLILGTRNYLVVKEYFFILILK